MTVISPHEIIAAVEAEDRDLAVTMVTDDVEYDNVPLGKPYGADGIRSVLSR